MSYNKSRTNTLAEGCVRGVLAICATTQGAQRAPMLPFVSSETGPLASRNHTHCSFRELFVLLRSFIVFLWHQLGKAALCKLYPNTNDW